MITVASCLIIGICGVSGAGKTEITRLLAERLKTTTLHWDDYDSLPDYEEPKDYIAWFHGNKDYTAWKSPGLVKALQALCQESQLKFDKEEGLSPSSIIIFDAPLGYEHHETGRFIDFLVFIDVPPDISLIRRLQRDHLNGSAPDVRKINEELDYYSNFSRPLYLDIAEKKNADLIVDGTLPKQKIVEQILDAIAPFIKEKNR